MTFQIYYVYDFNDEKKSSEPLKSLETHLFGPKF